ncbi:MAG TPA: Bax inhibitor-1/YccA family protein [Anaerolineales bacterium]|nr:Bax inhibitor-1/YccA family protein [Anaerolineales bacterium]
MTFSYQNEPAIQELDSVFNETFMNVMRHVYLWMCLGLFVTAFVSMALVYTPLSFLLVQILQVPFLFIGLLIGEVALVWWLSARIGTMSVGASRIGFLFYALLNGITMSVIFLAYTESSIALTFITTACVFGAMGIIGYTTKVDLSKWGSYLLMGLIGFLIGSVVNMFLANSTLEWMLTYAGIVLFIGLTVYDTQRIKTMVVAAMRSSDQTAVQRVGLLGALRLYLDFINLFLLLLRLMGGRRR